MKQLKLILILVVIYFNIFNIYSQRREAKANIDSSVFYFGSPVLLSIELTKNKNETLSFSNLYQSEVIEILKEEKSDSSIIDKERLKIIKKFIVTVYDTGINIIPPIPIIYQHNNSLDTVYTNLLTVYVKPIPIDTTGTIRDIKEIYKMPITLKEILFYIILVLIIATLIFIVIYILKKNKTKSLIINKPEKLEPPHYIALRELDNLKNSKLWQRNEIKLYYSLLSDILRKYIKYRFDINAMEMITDEILKEISQISNVDTESYNILKDILYDADMVKFANYVPEPTENIKHLDNAYKFIYKTKEEINLKNSNSENNPKNE